MLKTCRDCKCVGIHVQHFLNHHYPCKPYRLACACMIYTRVYRVHTPTHAYVSIHSHAPTYIYTYTNTCTIALHKECTHTRMPTHTFARVPVYHTEIH